MNELNAAIFSALSSGTALVGALGGTAIYHMQAPEGAALPYVVYSWQGGGRTNEVPNLTNRVEFVRAYAANAAQAGTIDAYCKALLDNKTLTVTGWTNIWTVREDDYESVETPVNGVPVYAIGGMYRVILDK